MSEPVDPLDEAIQDGLTKAAMHKGVSTRDIHTRIDLNSVTYHIFLQHVREWHEAQIQALIDAARVQMGLDINVQFRTAMMKQQLSPAAPKGARFRTPEEELLLIIAQLTKNNSEVKKGV